MEHGAEKRVISLLLACGLLFLLCSCASGGEPVASPESVTDFSEMESSYSSRAASSQPGPPPEPKTVSEPATATEPAASEASSDEALEAEPSASSQEAAETSLSESSAPEAPQPAPASGTRDNAPVVRIPSASGVTVYGNSLVSIDCSNASDGYIMVKYSGSNSKVKLLINTTYQYNLYAGYGYQAFPLSTGSGAYSIGVYENLYGDQYSQAYATNIDVTLSSSTIPFLYPNQYVNYNAGSAVVAKGSELAFGAASDLEVVANIYNWTISNVSYDFNKASGVTSGYVPDVDSTLASRTGICFDYAALMCAMLRTQNIPTRLVIGWSGSIYHAWISVYITDVGWLNDYIYFDGASWKRMDPTFASGDNNSRSINDYINNGGNYNAIRFQ